MEILDKMLNPAVIWVVIPVLGIVFWGLTSIIYAIRGKTDEPPEWKADLQNLRTRVEALERAQYAHQPSGGDTVVAAPARPN
jgi:hypothetical protein